MAVVHLVIALIVMNTILGLLGGTGTMIQSFIANPVGFFKKTPGQ